MTATTSTVDPVREFMAYKDTEFVIGLVAPTGTDLDHVSTVLGDLLKQRFKYKPHAVKMTDLIRAETSLQGYVPQNLDALDYNEKINRLMDAGNDIRRDTGRNDFMALLAIRNIASQRPTVTYVNREDSSKEKLETQAFTRTVHIVRQFKHPDEVRTFRKVYGPGFYLFGVHASFEERMGLFRSYDIPPEEAATTLERDRQEKVEHGQHTRETFALADAYVDSLSPQMRDEVQRILEIMFGNPHLTPTRDESCMFLAYAASFRSADFSRQVGAVLVSEKGDITATGANEVPKAEGGQYSSDDDIRCRDQERGYDSNEIRRKEILNEIGSVVKRKLEEQTHQMEEELKKLKPDYSRTTDDKALSAQLLKDLRTTSIWEITEYGRSVHAEMEAILSCARAGISTRGGCLYTTTFPCHNCGKHIVDAGIKKVIYVEPYPKSKVPELLSDSISIAGERPVQREKDDCTEPQECHKVLFEPFIGVSARRFVDLFSMHLSSGESQERKIDGKKSPFVPKKSNLKVPMRPTSYLERELIGGAECDKLLAGIPSKSDAT